MITSHHLGQLFTYSLSGYFANEGLLKNDVENQLSKERKGKLKLKPYLDQRIFRGLL
jgi:hypothetical protein